jgi:hypothetical protein
MKNILFSLGNETVICFTRIFSIGNRIESTVIPFSLGKQCEHVLTSPLVSFFFWKT